MAGFLAELVIFTMFLKSAVGGDTLIAYTEKPCCGTPPPVATKIRHHKAHPGEFSCGHLFYRTMFMNETTNTLYLGAMDRIYKLNMTDISKTHCEKDSLLLEPINVAQCVSKGKSEHFECHNHIRVIQPIGDGHRLYVCGTNAHSPKDWVVYLNLTHLSRVEYFPGIGMGTAKCPFDPSDNSTAVWVSQGNPGGVAALYAGTNGEFSRADPVIFRSDLYDPYTKQKRYHFKRTLKYDSKWLDKTNFVGSFDSGEYVFMFFRETAVEYMNCGKAVYSRVARICKMDTGGKHILNQNWATYLKARLNCSIPGEFPFYFDEIQSVYQVPEDNSRFYATFTTGSSDGLVGSAICSYSMSNIQEAFAGKYKEQVTSSSAWLPVLRNKVPEPRPGTCVNDTKSLPDTVLNFIRSHPLMDEAVRQDFDAPIFYKRDLILTQLVVAKLHIDMPGRNRHYTIFYAGTNDGLVYKIVHWVTEKQGQSRWNVVDIWRIAPDEPIRVMRLSNTSLYVATDHRVRQLPLERCRKRYDSCVRCALDPYCGWDNYKKICDRYRLGLLQDVTNSTTGLCENDMLTKSLQVSYGQSLHLTSYLNMPDVFKSQIVKWYHHSKERGKYEVKFGSGKLIETIENGLVILSVTESDAGKYECMMGPIPIATYNIQIDTHRCTHPTKIQEYKKVYSDWCHEFEKYKDAKKRWDDKNMHCSKQNISQNMLSNEIVPGLR